MFSAPRGVQTFGGVPGGNAHCSASPECRLSERAGSMITCPDPWFLHLLHPSLYPTLLSELASRIKTPSKLTNLQLCKTANFADFVAPCPYGPKHCLHSAGHCPKNALPPWVPSTVHPDLLCHTTQNRQGTRKLNHWTRVPFHLNCTVCGALHPRTSLAKPYGRHKWVCVAKWESSARSKRHRDQGVLGVLPALHVMQKL